MPVSSQPSARIALLGGLYSNYLALEVALADALGRGVDEIYCLGDLGAFGPHPDRVFPLLAQHEVLCLQGNYDHSIGFALDDCQCGYTDPRDNYFAKLSYDYTLANTSDSHRTWLRTLPSTRRLELGRHQVLLCHGSPRRVNEFLWESTTADGFLNYLLAEFQADVIAGTHTGLHWHRTLQNRHWVNVGVLGRPANDGKPNVWYTLLSETSQGLDVQFVPVQYNHQRLAAEMQQEKLPEEFIQTVLTGWWTTCLEILPAKERRQGRF